MNRLRKSLCALFSVIMLSSCGGIGGDSVEAAEEEYASGHIEAAQAICDSLVLGSDFAGLSVNELCRLSVLTSRLAEHDNEDVNMALAAKCMQAAMLQNADSVLAFVHSLPADEQSRTLFVRQLTRMIDPSCDNVEIFEENYTDPDSITDYSEK